VKHLAQRRTFRVGIAVVQVNELAELVDVLDRVLQRGLPPAEQHNNEYDACEAVEHFARPMIADDGD
jgi:hypothetical protein